MKLFALILLSVFAASVFAQQDQTTEQVAEESPKKKPSWSTGLPERKSTPSMNKPSVNLAKPEIDLGRPDVIEMPTSDVEIDRESFAMPEIVIEPAASSSLPPAARSASKIRRSVRSHVNEEATANAVADVVPQAAKVVVGITVNQNNYNWEILQSEPVKIPKSLSFNYKSVDLEVHINPEGKVIEVKLLSDLTSMMILDYSIKALEKWQFRPPSEFGITEVIKNNIRVDLVAG